MDAVEVRILTYNIRSLRDDRAAVAEVIRRSAPDVVCVQEAPRFLRWRQAAARLARDTGLTVVGGGAPASGNLLLAALRVYVVGVRAVPLPHAPRTHRRAAAVAELRVGGAHLAVAGTHWGGDQHDRHAQARGVLAALDACPGAHQVVGGDFNETDDGAGRRALDGQLRDCWTQAPTWGEHTNGRQRPHRRIDALYASEAVGVTACGVPTDLPDSLYESASDHRPVLAVLRVPRGGGVTPG